MATIRLQKRLDVIGKPTPEIMGLKIKGARWSRPQVRAEMKCRATTREGLQRHAGLGVRED